MDQILANTFNTYAEPAWVMEVRPDKDRWLGSNNAAKQLLADLDVANDNLEVILGSLGVPRSLIMGGLWALGSFSTSTELGIVHATRITGEARPPLMVVTLHNSDEAEAWRHHNTMVMSLRINEEVAVAVQLTLTAVVQMEGVVGRLQDMLHDFNDSIGSVLKRPQQILEEVQQRGLTASDRARQG